MSLPRRSRRRSRFSIPETKLHFRPATGLSQVPANYWFESAILPDVHPEGRGNPNPTSRDRLPWFRPESAVRDRQTRPNPHGNDSNTGWAATRKRHGPPDDGAMRSPAVPAGTRNFLRRERSKFAALAAACRMLPLKSVQPYPAASPPACPRSRASCSSTSAAVPSCPRDEPAPPRLHPRSDAEMSQCPDRRDFYCPRDCQSAPQDGPPACTCSVLCTTRRYPAKEPGTMTSAGPFPARTVPARHH